MSVYAWRKRPRTPVVIKKYANRRLYNTQISYVTLDHLAQMVKEGKEFEVRDARTGEDITRSVLTQIIFEEEAKGQSLLPIKFLRQLIRFYGDSLQSFVPGYLDMSIENLKRQADSARSMSKAFGGGGRKSSKTNAPQHGDVRARHADVSAVRAEQRRQCRQRGGTRR